MTWLKVEGFDMVNSNNSFILLHSSNWNWFMNVASSHEMSQANCLKFDAYTITECDPRRKDHNLVVDMCSLSECPSLALNSSRNALKSLNKGDWCSNKNVYQARAMFNNRVLRSPTWVKSNGYWWRWSQRLNALCWQNFKTFTMNHQSCWANWFATPLVRVGSWKCIPTWVSLISNPNHEIKKTRTRTQCTRNKNQTRFYYKNKTK
jgi:hypothetical protein